LGNGQQGFFFLFLYSRVTKCADLSNFVPDDIEHLRDAVIESVGDLEWDERLKHPFFQTAQLPL
jgi:hypothetical protein